jgi:K+-sensing histidine kinase KdpD
MRAKRDLRYRATVKASDSGAGLAFVDYCATRDDAILFCLLQMRRLSGRATAAWVDELLPEPKPSVWVAGPGSDWQVVDRRPWSPRLIVRGLAAIGIVLFAQWMSAMVLGCSTGTMLWSLAVAVIASAALLGILPGAVSVVTATLTSDFFAIPPIQSFTFNGETLRFGLLYACVALMGYAVAKKVQKLVL